MAHIAFELASRDSYGATSHLKSMREQRRRKHRAHPRRGDREAPWQFAPQRHFITRDNGGNAALDAAATGVAMMLSKSRP
jgi:hypothetical protein